MPQTIFSNRGEIERKQIPEVQEPGLFLRRGAHFFQFQRGNLLRRVFRKALMDPDGSEATRPLFSCVSDDASCAVGAARAPARHGRILCQLIPGSMRFNVPSSRNRCVLTRARRAMLGTRNRYSPVDAARKHSEKFDFVACSNSVALVPEVRVNPRLRASRNRQFEQSVP